MCKYMTENNTSVSQDPSKSKMEERTIRKDAGFYLSEEEILNKEDIKDNMDYLTCASSMHFDMLEDVFEVQEDRSPAKFEEISSRYRERRELLEKKRELGEEKAEKKFPCTLAFENSESTEEEKTVLLQLLGIRGLGVKTSQPVIPGETIMLTLKLLHDTPVEIAWKILCKYSDMVQYGIIKKTSVDDCDGVEGSLYSITETGIGLLLGLDAKDMINHDLNIMHKYVKPIGKYFKPDDDPKDGCIGIDGAEDKKEEDLGPLEKISSKVSFQDDVILPKDLKQDITGAMAQYKNKEKFDGWGMNHMMEGKTGLNLLFSGPSGTGKTMTAKAIGDMLGKETYFVSYPKLLSHWYGGTEKNIGKIFEIINSRDPVIVLDEADGILNKRFPSRGGAESTENRIVTLFLQQFENTSAIFILTTNISTIIDTAFERRIDLKAEFPMPCKNAREKIWLAHIPEELPLSEDVDISELAKKYEFSGGQIKNAVVNAVRYALSNDADEVCQKDFIGACEKELSGTKAMNYTLDEKKNEEVRGYS